jgi:hypothetical protein
MEIVERILEAVVLFAALRAGLALVELPWGDGQGRALRAELRRRPLPVVAITLMLALTAGLVVSLASPAALRALSDPPGAAGWRLFTAPFVQDGGVLGGLWNVITAFAVLTLAEWAWGPVTAALIWLAGAWAPLGDLAALAGYHVSQSDVSAYSAGSSGATYFTAATLCAALLVLRSGRARWANLAVPALGLVMWLATNDGHGVLMVEGFLAGLLLAGLWSLLGHCGAVNTISRPSSAVLRKKPRISSNQCQV